MNNQQQDLLSLVQIKIRKRIVTELKKDFELEGNRGFQVGFGNRIDIWLPISPDSKNQWSDEKAVVIMERVFGRKFPQTFQVQFPQRTDIWFPIPPNLSLEEWSNEEVSIIAGKAVMIAWSWFPAHFSDEELAKEMLMLGFSIHPGMIFEVGSGLN